MANDSDLPPPPKDAPTPAESLTGLVLNSQWKVIEYLPSPPAGSGGWFSRGYLVESVVSGERGFLKALDFAKMFQNANPLAIVQAETQQAVFEKALLEACARRRMPNVVKCLATGTVTPPGFRPTESVHYFIFERADADARQRIFRRNDFDLGWAATVLQHAALGLGQLHGEGIAHQDLKLSNVLLFGRAFAKLGDLGSATARDLNWLAQHGSSREERFAIASGPAGDSELIAGDVTYAPPELIYHATPSGWDERRRGCDAYLLGSLIFAFMTGIGMTAAVQNYLADAHKAEQWGGKFSEVLPYLRHAFNRTLEDLGLALRGYEPNARHEIVSIVRELCTQDPAERGDPKERLRLASGSKGADPYSLQRYVSRLAKVVALAKLKPSR